MPYIALCDLWVHIPPATRQFFGDFPPLISDTREKSSGLLVEKSVSKLLPDCYR